MRDYLITIIINFLITLLVAGGYFCLWVLRDLGVIHSGAVFAGILVATVILPVLIVITSHIGDRKWSRLNAMVYAISSCWIGFEICFLGTFVILVIMHAVIATTSLAFGTSNFYWGILGIVCATALSLGSLLNASHARVVYKNLEKHTLPSALKGKKILIVSDLHIGMVRHRHFVQHVVNLIMKEKPDLILIPGDMIDGPKFPYKEFLEPFERLSAPLGIYFTGGNHEQYNSENELFYEALPKNITVLLDRKVDMKDIPLQIIGIDFGVDVTAQTVDRLKKSGFDKTIPSIVLLHDPKNIPALADMGVAFIVSGHTHGGQLFPGNIFVRLLYKQYTRGLAYTAGVPSFTSVGIGTALVPMRLGTRPELVVIRVV